MSGVEVNPEAGDTVVYNGKSYEVESVFPQADTMFIKGPDGQLVQDSLSELRDNFKNGLANLIRKQN